MNCVKFSHEWSLSGVYEKRDDLKPTQMDPEAPASFRPIPVADPVVMPEPTPPEVPPKPFDDPKIFDNVDKHAFEVNLCSLDE